MGRPKNTTEKRRMTVLLSVENDEFVRKYADSRSINLSTAVNIIFADILKGNFDSLREAVMDHSHGRQF